MMADLTLPISPRLPTFPDSPPPRFIGWSELRGRGGYNMELVFMSSHSGTHIDAPYHFARGGRTVDKIPVGRLAGRSAILIRIPKGAGGAVTRSDIASHERKNGTLPRDCTVVFCTGWQKNRLHSRDYFTRNPGLSRDAARYLASRKANLVGIDSPSIDAGGDDKFPAHRLLSKNDVLIVENLAGLEAIRRAEFTLWVMPLKLRGASGSPVRAVGIY